MKIKQVVFNKKIRIFLLLSMMVGFVQTQAINHVFPPNPIFLSASNGFSYNVDFNIQQLYLVTLNNERALEFKIYVAPNTKIEISLSNALAPYNFAYLSSYSSGILEEIGGNNQFYYTFETGASSDILDFGLWYSASVNDIVGVNMTATSL